MEIWRYGDNGDFGYAFNLNNKNKNLTTNFKNKFKKLV